MDVHNDRTLYKLILAVASIFLFPFFVAGYVHFGPKWLLFALWLVFAFVLFVGFVIFLVRKPHIPTSRNFVISWVQIYESDLLFKVALGLFAGLLWWVSYYVWQFLGL